MIKRLNQQGSTLFVAVLAVALIAIAGLVGYRVLNDSSNSGSTTTQSSQSSQSAKSSEAIKSSSDVKKASTELESTNVDTQVNPDELDSDINSIL